MKNFAVMSELPHSRLQKSPNYSHIRFCWVNIGLTSNVNALEGGICDIPKINADLGGIPINQTAQ